MKVKAIIMAMCLVAMSVSFAEPASKAMQSKVVSAFDTAVIAAKPPQALSASADFGGAVKTSNVATEAEFEFANAALDAILEVDIDKFKSELDKIKDINVVFPMNDIFGDENLLIILLTMVVDWVFVDSKKVFTPRHEAFQYLIDRGIDVNFVWEVSNDHFLAMYYGANEFTALDYVKFTNDTEIAALLEAAGGKRFSEL